MKLFFVRHGETIRNKQRISQEQIKGKLSAEGIRQAKKLARRLSHENFDIIYCSDSERTRQTAKEILKHHTKVPVVYTPLLREQHQGILAGKTWEENTKIRKTSPLGYADFKPKGGESKVDLINRVRPFIKEIIGKHEGQTVLFIAHGHLNRALRHVLEGNKGKPKRENNNHQHNTCVNIATFKQGKPVITLYNCTKHLE